MLSSRQMRAVRALIRLRWCAVWSASSLPDYIKNHKIFWNVSIKRKTYWDCANAQDDLCAFRACVKASFRVTRSKCRIMSCFREAEHTNAFGTGEAANWNSRGYDERKLVEIHCLPYRYNLLYSMCQNKKECKYVNVSRTQFLRVRTWI